MAPAFPPPLSPQELNQFFPLATPAPDPQSFELGLVLGGTVSAGAYTAGVLDFMIEALDAWYRQKEIEARQNTPQDQRQAPLHDLRLEITTGTSGGGVCATLLSRALQFEFPHMTPTTDRNLPGNPFYELWVRGFFLMGPTGLLATRDLDATPPPDKLPSLLDTTVVDDLGNAAVGFTGNPLGTSTSPQKRAYVRNPLRVVMTLTNLRGVPYMTAFSGIPAGSTPTATDQGEFFVDHADYGRFAVEQPTGMPARQGRRPDEFFVPAASSTSGGAAWAQLAEYGKATGAFPGGFRARSLTRPIDHYRYRVTVQPDAMGVARTIPLVPAWDQLVDPQSGNFPSDYSFCVVDGGALNNEPIGLAHTWLAGMTGFNSREPKKSQRAILLVDPLASGPSLGPSANPGLVRLVAPFILGEVVSARYLTTDMLLMADATVFSRFLLTASGTTARGWQVGETAIAGSGLGAFAGFLHEDLRRHDYLLGRANCQRFLKSDFALDAENPLFAQWTPPQRAQFAVKDASGRDFLPIIPLMAAVAGAEPDPPWPKVFVNDGALSTNIGARLAAVIARFEADELEGNAALRLLVSGIRSIGSESIGVAVVKAARQYLTDAGLA